MNENTPPTVFVIARVTGVKEGTGAPMLGVIETATEPALLLADAERQADELVLKDGAPRAVLSVVMVKSRETHVITNKFGRKRHVGAAGIGSFGGRARAAALTPERRHEIAQMAALHRWGTDKKDPCAV